MAAAPAANCCSTSAYARARPPRVLRQVASIWRTSASAASRSEEHTSELQSHQYLHSFPTRRSSDLRPARTPCPRPGCGAGPYPSLGGPPDAPLVQWRPHRLPTAAQPLRTPGLGLRACSARSPRFGAPALPLLRDRKSTRLNSSHTNIYTLSLHDALPISDPRVRRALDPDVGLGHIQALEDRLMPRSFNGGRTGCQLLLNLCVRQGSASARAPPGRLDLAHQRFRCFEIGRAHV